MSTSLFFNLSFDLGGISLILFVVWFFINFHNPAAAFKWFSLSMLTLLASVIILSYGDIKLSNVKSTLPTQNQTEIANLKQKVNSLEGKKSDSSTSSSQSSSNEPSKPTHHKKESSSKISVPSRIVNSHDNDLLKEAVAKHDCHITLVAKVLNQSPKMVRGVHSSQDYEIHGSDKDVTVGEFVVIKGTATSNKDGAIQLTATSIKKQSNS